LFRIARVIVDAVIGSDDKIFDYSIGEFSKSAFTVSPLAKGGAAQRAEGGAESEIVIGFRVLVPFGGRDIEGFILALHDKTDVPLDKIKPITRVLDDFAALNPECLAILDQICDTFKLRKIDVLRLFVPSPLRGRKRKRIPKNKEIRAVSIEAKNVTLTEQQESVADAIFAPPAADAPPPFAEFFSQSETITNSPLAKGGGASAAGGAKTERPHADGVVNRASVFVLHGVTGSGKTEVYMNVIQRVLAKNQTAIMLVPEIGLTPQVLANFRARFGNLVAILHSGLTTGERYDEWYRLHTGEARIAIGARSAVFAPVENVGVIIIDEEHDGSYYSESNPRFHTHEIAKIRCAYNKCPLVLGSATPSVESFHKTATKEYKLLKLDRRVNNLAMPTIEVVDMVAELRAGNGGIFSRAFIDRLTRVLDDGKQAIIFLNRRGFSSFVMCKSCGWVAKCESCDVSLVYHKEDSQLKCHYCASRFTPVTRCAECSSTYLKHGATGTQKLVEELEKMFSGQEKNNNSSLTPKVFRMDADNVKTKDNLVDILDEFGKTPRAILVGTQMVAKGHHFPNVALVGIIDADNSLHFSDYRATERTFALITQVAGRAGRDGAGHVVLQTYLPKHYVYRLAANYDYAKFFDKEINTRAVTKYPPFTTVVRILVTDERADRIKDVLQNIMLDLRKDPPSDFVYLGAMKSPLGRLQNKFRYQILARFPRENEKAMLDFIDTVVKKHQPKNMQVFLEINPQSLS